MLDINFNTEFKPEVKLQTKGSVDALVISSCAVHMYPNDDRMVSDFDDLCYNELNNPTKNYGMVDFEIGLNGYSGSAYPQVFTKCFSLHTDDFLLIKPLKLFNNCSESKINERGEMVIGIRYYFKNKDEVVRLSNCKRFLFESFFALEKPKNVYAIMCQFEKVDNVWKIKYANTYRPRHARNIKDLID